jgi:hypothetical protein
MRIDRHAFRLLLVVMSATAVSCANLAGAPPPAATSSATATAAPLPATTSSAPTTSAASASAADLVAVAKLIYPYDAQYGYYTVCGANGDLSRCPVTDRLKAYLTQKQMTLCGCQNPAPSMDATATSTGPGGVAHVTLGYQPTPVRFDLIIVRDGGRLLVDDQQCTGVGPSSSIYTRTAGC